MKTGFKDRIATKGSQKTMKSPWNYDQPHYDERSSCYVNAGSHYGVGHRQPVGTETHSGKSGVPFGRGHTMKDDEVPHKNLRIEMNE